MRDFHIFWMQYGMDHYLFLHLIAFIIQKYSVPNDNKEPLLRRPNSSCVIGSAQLLVWHFMCHPPPGQRAAHPKPPRREEQGPPKWELSLFYIHPCPVMPEPAARAGRMLLQLPGAGFRLTEGTGSRNSPGSA